MAKYQFNPNIVVDAEVFTPDISDDFKDMIETSGVHLEERATYSTSKKEFVDRHLVITDRNKTQIATSTNKSGIVISNGVAEQLLGHVRIFPPDQFRNLFVPLGTEIAPPAVEPDTEIAITDIEYRDAIIRACIFMESGAKDASTPVKAENVSGDSGGLTKYGICKKSYPKLDIANLTYQQAFDIYINDYWKSAKSDLIPRPLNALTFDFCVTSGPKNAMKILQRAVGTPDDGIWGPKTNAAAQEACSTMPKLLAATRLFTEKRIAYYQAIVTNKPNQAKFLNGWINRAIRSQNFAQAVMYTLDIL